MSFLCRKDTNKLWIICKQFRQKTAQSNIFLDFCKKEVICIIICQNGVKDNLAGVKGKFLQDRLRSRRKPQKVLLSAEELLRFTVEVGLAGASVLDIADGADDGADGDGSGVEGELRKDGIVVGE